MRSALLVRHCESTGPEPHAPLTPAGHEQARRLVERLRPLGVDHVASSPLTRARQSSEPFARELGLTTSVDDRLAERRLASVAVPDLADEVRRSFEDPDRRLPGGESGREAKARGCTAIDGLLRSAHRLPLAVTHGQLLAWILRSIDGAFGFAEWRTLSNPDVYRIDVAPDGNRRFTRLPSS